MPVTDVQNIECLVLSLFNFCSFVAWLVYYLRKGRRPRSNFWISLTTLGIFVFGLLTVLCSIRLAFTLLYLSGA